MRAAAGRVFAFYWGQGIADDVPALAYYLLLSLGPFALGMAALEALLLEDFVGALAVADQVNRFLPEAVDRKSTRLNSSHANISYAVFCLIKKKKRCLLCPCLV